MKDLYFTGDVYTRPEDNIAVGSIYRVSLYHTIREEKRGQYRTYIVHLPAFFFFCNSRRINLVIQVRNNSDNEISLPKLTNYCTT